jgi:predicted acyl esterase
MSASLKARLALLLSLLLVSAGLLAPTPAAAAGPTFRTVEITARDGVVLKGNVFLPVAAGPRPAVVFVASWAVNDVEYLAQAKQLAERGYVVLSYTTRGFWGSGGRIDVAGPLDAADASSAIDWLLANTAASPARIGFAGISYGAGISLIASGHDPRIKAVAALSGWGDLVEALYGNSTRHGQAAALLKYSAELTGRPGAEMSAMLDRFFANRDVETVKRWARSRGAATFVDQINRNGPAILLANAYGDSLFPPNQLVDFYGRLTVPKRLELAPGDHFIAEATGLVGLPNHVWTSLHRWFDQYLASVDTGIDDEQPVVLRPRGTSAVESYDDWADTSSSRQRYELGAMRWYDGTGPLSSDAGTGWDRKIWSGLDTVACGGIALLTNGWEALTGIPPTAWLPAVNRLNAAVWTSEPIGTTSRVRGVARLHLTMKPSIDDAMVVAYLYDVDGLGTGRLVTHVPYTGGSAGEPVAVDLAFPATAYDIPAGHRLALVIDTEDPLYLDNNRFASELTFGSPVDNQSWLDVPLR